MITVEYDNESEVSLIFDDNGIIKLMGYLKLLIEGKDTHYHLMTEDFGGYELSNKLINNKNIIINMIRLQKVK